MYLSEIHSILGIIICFITSVATSYKYYNIIHFQVK